jgi:hypothetical protein
LNYLAHGFRFVDRPWFLAGTAVPDWLAASDRRARVRRERLPADDALADGMRQHLDDDDRFHRTEAFQRAESDLTELFRSTKTHRCWFFGHICVELLLDGWLCERHPTLIDDYFQALSKVDPAELVARVSPWLSRPPERLDEFIGIFTEHKFVAGYTEDASLLQRMQGVARRVGLDPLPAEVLEMLPRARERVYGVAEALLRTE